MTIIGVLGESNRMLDAEREQLITAAVEVATEIRGTKSFLTDNILQKKGFSICVGTSHAGTAASIGLSQMAQDLGADAVMITPV